MRAHVVTKLMGAAALLSMLQGVSARADSLPCNEKFTLVNKTPYDVVGVLASNIYTRKFLPNMLHDGDYLPPGGQIEVNPYDGSTARHYDFKFVFRNGQTIEKHDVNVCRVEKYTLLP